jgi:predicted transport protein
MRPCFAPYGGIRPHYSPLVPPRDEHQLPFRLTTRRVVTYEHSRPGRVRVASPLATARTRTATLPYQLLAITYHLFSFAFSARLWHNTLQRNAPDEGATHRPGPRWDRTHATIRGVIEAREKNEAREKPKSAGVPASLSLLREKTMKAIIKCIEGLRVQLQRHHGKGMKEYPTRTIFIDPLLQALHWDVRDPDEVELEYPTVDGKSVDYAMKINRRVVLLVEAKQLEDPLDDVKSITQVVGYAANDGIEWCVLTNGIRYRVYRASERASAPDKLLFEVSIEGRESEGLPIEQIAAQLNRLSKDSLAEGVLDRLGAEIFTTGKVRKALDRLFTETPSNFVRLVRKAVSDGSVTPSQIQQALGRIWHASAPAPNGIKPRETRPQRHEKREKVKGSSYTEADHTTGKPTEVIELYRGLDRLCQELAPGKVTRAYKAKYVTWAMGKRIFCCAHIQQGGLRVWVKTDPKGLDPSQTFARDVSRVGHWGTGDVELALDSLERLRETASFVRQSFEETIQRT